MTGLLFDPSKYEKRKAANQLQFEKNYYTILLKIKSIIDESFQETQKVLAQIPPACRDKSLFAMLMSGFINGYVRQNFPECTSFDVNGRTLLSKDKKFALYFKKLNNKKRPDNVKTEYSEMLYHQLTMPGDEKSSVVFVGYTIDETKAAITGYYSVCLEGDEILWTTDISTLGNDNSASDAAPVVPMLPLAPKKDRVRVVAKKKKSNEE